MLAASPNVVLQATAVLHPDADPSVNGTIHFVQNVPLGTVKITGEIHGLVPNALRGFHIQYVSCFSDVLIVAINNQSYNK